MRVGQLFDSNESSLLKLLKHDLGDSIAAVDREIFIRGVEENDGNLASIGRVDGARRVHDRDAVLCSEARTRMNQRDVSVGKRDCDPGRKGSAAASRNNSIDARAEVGAGVARVGVCGRKFVVTDEENRKLRHHQERNLKAMKNSGDLTETYSERLWPSPWLLLAITPLGAAIWLATLPFIPGFSQTLGVLVVVAMWLVQLTRVAKISVSKGFLQAGPAKLPIAAIGELRVLRGSEALAARGPQLNPAAFKLFRAGVPIYLYVEVEDKNDPTPYWLIASRQPELLEKALRLAIA